MSSTDANGFGETDTFSPQIPRASSAGHRGDVIDREVRRHVGCMVSKDGIEGAQAFLEKREARFIGA